MGTAGSLLGGLVGMGTGFMKSGAARDAGNTMGGTDMMAALMQQQMFQQIMQDLLPFKQYGQNALTSLAPLIGIGGNPMTAELTRRFNPTMAELEKTPGYQFTLGQGLKTLDNQFAAKGMGLSGNQLRGAADYTTGLASQTYQQQFQNHMAENQNIYNMLSGAGNVGLQAAGMGANAAGQFGNMIGNSMMSGGNAYGQSRLAGANALTQGIAGAYGALPESFTNMSLKDMGKSFLDFFK